MRNENRLALRFFICGLCAFTALSQIDGARAQAETAQAALEGNQPLGCAGYQQYLLLPLLPRQAASAIAASSHEGARGRRLQIGLGREFERPLVLDRRTSSRAWTTLPDGTRSYATFVASPGAVGLRVKLEEVALPKGAELLVGSAEDLSQPAQTINQESLREGSNVWSETVFSSTVVVEARVPAGVNPQGVHLKIGSVSHLFSLAETATMSPKEGSCYRDASCYPSYSSEASGVARITFVEDGNTYVCTGCLLQGGSGGNYFLTANHCIRNQSLASSMELFWFYQTSGCNGAVPDLSSVPSTKGGADILAASPDSDFTFLRLRRGAPSGARKLSWSTATPSSSEDLVCIHHPGGAYKRLNVGRLVGTDPYFWGVRWLSGVTEDGSSGSPLLNQNHEVIGQLNAGFHGPGSSCSNPSAPDQFGRFDMTFAAIQRWLGRSGSGGGNSDGFSPGKASFNGLVLDSSGSPSTSGYLTFTTSTKSSFSGRMQLGRNRFSFSGRFDSEGSAQISIRQRSGNPLTLSTSIDTSNPSSIQGTVTDGSFSAEFSADRVVFDGRSAVAPQAGIYTVVMPGNPGSDTLPGGDSYGVVTVTRAGGVRLSGSMADGTKVSQSSYISQQGNWPLFVPLYGGSGSLIGQVTFGDDGDNDLFGNVTWSRPNNPSARTYPLGFQMQTQLAGSHYTRPSAGTNPLSASDANVSVQGGDVTQGISEDFTFGPGSRILNSEDRRLKISFSPSTGLLRGSVTVPESGRPLAFSGVALQRQRVAAGYYLGRTQSGKVAVVPYN